MSSMATSLLDARWSLVAGARVVHIFGEGQYEDCPEALEAEASIERLRRDAVGHGESDATGPHRHGTGDRALEELAAESQAAQPRYHEEVGHEGTAAPP